MHSACFIDVVEAAYSLEQDEQAWLGGLARTAAPALDRGLGVVAYLGETKSLKTIAYASHAITTDVQALFGIVAQMSPSETTLQFQRRSVGFSSMREAFFGDDSLEDVWIRAQAVYGFADAITVHGHGANGCTVHIFAVSKRQEEVTPRLSRVWERIAYHIAAGHRLRTRLAAPDALLDANGKMHHSNKALGTKAEALRQAVRDREKSRGPLRRKDGEEALALWRGLAAGKWSLVDQWDSDGKRFVAALENQPPNLDPRALRPREGAAASLAARGAAAKDIAYALGISPSNARALLASSLGKLGLGSRAELYRYDPASADVYDLAGVSVLAIPERKPELSGLTNTEKEVARLAADGWSNEAIAKRRGTSVRTVANQMAAILRKLNILSRADIRLAAAD